MPITREGQSWSATQKIRTFALKYKKLDVALRRLNQERISRRYRTTQGGGQWDFEIQPMDYVKGLEPYVGPELIPAMLDLAGVYLDEIGMMRQKPLGGSGFLEGTEPPDTPAKHLPLASNLTSDLRSTHNLHLLDGVGFIFRKALDLGEKFAVTLFMLVDKFSRINRQNSGRNTVFQRKNNKLMCFTRTTSTHTI